VGGGADRQRVRGLIVMRPLILPAVLFAIGCAPPAPPLGELAEQYPTEVMVGRHPLLRGTLSADHAYTLGRTDWRPHQNPVIRTYARRGMRVLLRASLADATPEGYKLGGRWDTEDWGTRQAPAPCRWQIADGELFLDWYEGRWSAVSGRITEAEYGRAVRDPECRLDSYRLTPQTLAHGRIRDMTQGDLHDGLERRSLTGEPTARRSGHGFELGPFNRLFDGSPHREHPDALPPDDRLRAHFDFRPDTTDRIELFVLHPGRFGRHLIFRTPDGERPNWTEIEGRSPDWDGPFYVAADGADRHFVVPGGRVFSLPADAQPGSALVKTWDREPVVALVHDADAGKSYAFTKTHYFHLTAKPEPKPHAIPAFPGATAEEALDTVAKCGRVIRGLK
jgi:hypothetical protein